MSNGLTFGEASRMVLFSKEVQQEMAQNDLRLLVKDVLDAVEFGAGMFGFREPLPEDERTAVETALRKSGFEPSWETPAPETSTTTILRWTTVPLNPTRRGPTGSAIREVTEQAGLSR